MNILVFDIETIPNIELGKKLFDLDKDMPDSEVAEVMFTKREEKTDGRTRMLQVHQQKILVISVLICMNDQIKMWSLGRDDSDEKQIVTRFFKGIEKYTQKPTLVSWNGIGFDAPLLHYRALSHGVSSPSYWDTGQRNTEFRWNNYQNRYHQKHTDIMDSLAMHNSYCFAPLTEIAVSLGLPGKLGMDGSKVWDNYKDGKVSEICDYCETDVLNTFLVYLKFELIRGHISQEQHDGLCSKLVALLQEKDLSHFKEFLSSWESQPKASNVAE
ncbi:MAG: 3'-5' exonuclease [Thiotrichales bacterium]|nr:MAG: 3'-5' exonuclease [Thiotrichales bacterium]